MKTLASLGILILFICVLGAAHAQIPRTLSYQGVLTDVKSHSLSCHGNFSLMKA